MTHTRVHTTHPTLKRDIERNLFPETASGQSNGATGPHAQNRVKLLQAIMNAAGAH
eukprot:CAMPEP_0119080402 /NCGR_PEP_ID=MMETSP1178-20130426/111794_1 /TAXON_ID=33656 /ORGANISM="unid sp, Strain CCMP2000" /LENGTH=55 /DNA_ID=CAMNT_0007062997 /DNA_START=25 /DNA_END=192 /DNA_ORIENTATION=+